LAGGVVMPSQVLFKSAAGKITVAPAYFASAKFGSLLGEGKRPVEVRTAEKALVYTAHKRTVLKAPEFLHLLKSATDLSGSTIAADSRSLDAPTPITIDGIAVQVGDLIEIRKAQAATLKISPGTWTAETTTHLSLSKPPVYTATSISNFGYGWRYRKDTNGDLIGLAQVIPSNIVLTQNRATVPVGSMENLLDTNLTSLVAMSSASWQGMTATFDVVSHVRRIALAANSVRMSYDASFPAADFSISDNAGVISSLFWNMESRSQGGSPWSYGTLETYATNIIDRSISKFVISDDSGSRTYVSLEICIDGASQILIKGEAPTNGSRLIISESVASAFFPVISSGTYDVINNDGISQWRLRKG
jgi:hypothetical protein